MKKQLLNLPHVPEINEREWKCFFDALNVLYR